MRSIEFKLVPILLLGLNTSAYSWDVGCFSPHPHSQMLEGFKCSVLKGLVIVSIVVFGTMIALDIPKNPHGRKIIQLFFGLSIAAGAAQITSSFLPALSCCNLQSP